MSSVFEQFIDVIETGNIDTVLCFYSKHVCTIQNAIHFKNLFSFVCKKGQLEIAKWFINIFCIDDAQYSSGLNAAITHGNIEIVIWIITEYSNFLNSSDMLLAYRVSIINLQKDIVHCILEIAPDFDYHDEYNGILEYCCEFNDVEVCKLLFELYPELEIDRRDCMVAHFNHSLNVLKLFIDKPNITEDVVEYIFENSITYRRADIIEKIYSRFPHVISGINHIAITVMFISVCEHSYDMNIAKLLFRIRPDIDIRYFQDNLFKSCFKKRGDILQIEMAKWLESLRPDVYEIMPNNEYIIYSEKDIIWRRKRFPLWLSSDLTPCKKNLLYRMPEDVSRYIIECYL